MLQNDRWIKERGTTLINPFEPNQIRERKGLKVVSYGCSSYGYDLRLSPHQFLIFRHVPGWRVDPKQHNPQTLISIGLHNDEHGSYFILPGHSYGLGVALERINIPPMITALCFGKSTYARLGIIVNATPAEAEWRGHLTLEISNSSAADCKIYANEGICQLLFFEGNPCEVTYEDRSGKYQDQPESVTLACV